jgi:hypothetical protein
LFLHSRDSEFGSNEKGLTIAGLSLLFDNLFKEKWCFHTLSNLIIKWKLNFGKKKIAYSENDFDSNYALRT